MLSTSVLRPASVIAALVMAAVPPLGAQEEPIPVSVAVDRPIEVTQGIQTPGNTIPLVGGRTTWVRVYLSTTAERVSPVHGKLLVETAATRLAIVPSTGDGAVPPPPGRSERLRLNTSLVFSLPPELTEPGEVRLELVQVHDAETGAALECRDCSDHAARVAFEPGAMLRLRLIGLRYRRRGEHAPREEDFRAIQDWITRAYPVSAVVLDTITVRALDTIPSCEEMNLELARIRALDLASGQHPQTHYYGLVRDTPVYSDELMRGCSLGIPDTPDASTVATGLVGDPRHPRYTQDRQFNWDRSSSYAGWYAGHEIAHTLGRRHPGICGQTPDDQDGAVENSADLRNSVVGELGLDPLTRQIYNRERWRDVMTYCPYQWISGRTYIALLRRFREEDALYQKSADTLSTPAGALAQFAQMLLHPVPTLGDSILEVIVKFRKIEAYKGRIQAAFTATHRGRPAMADVQMTDTTPEERLVTIELVYGPGRVRYPASIMVNRPRLASADAERLAPPTGEGWVHAFIPNFPGEGWIRLLRSHLKKDSIRLDVLIDSIWKSASPPRLDSVSHAITTSATGTEGYKYSWVAIDPDDARTRVTVYVQASFDGGESWRVVEQTRKQEALVPCALLSGRESARVRLIASDGVNQAIAYTGDELVQTGKNPCTPWTLPDLEPAPEGGGIAGRRRPGRAHHLLELPDQQAGAPSL